MSRPSLEKHGAPDLLRDLADQASKLIEQFGVSPTEAYLLGARIADGFANRWAGVQVYIPSGTYGHVISCFKRAERDIEIYRAYTGRNADDLAGRYGITPRRVRQVYTRLRTRFRRPLTGLHAPAHPLPPPAHTDSE